MNASLPFAFIIILIGEKSLHARSSLEDEINLLTQRSLVLYSSPSRLRFGTTLDRNQITGCNVSFSLFKEEEEEKKKGPRLSQIGKSHLGPKAFPPLVRQADIHNGTKAETRGQMLIYKINLFFEI